MHIFFPCHVQKSFVLIVQVSFCQSVYGFFVASSKYRINQGVLAFCRKEQFGVIFKQIQQQFVSESLAQIRKSVEHGDFVDRRRACGDFVNEGGFLVIRITFDGRFGKKEIEALIAFSASVICRSAF